MPVNVVTRWELLERERELEAIDRVLAAATDGSTGGALLLEGSAGIGKSRLLEEGAVRAAAAGATVLRAQGHELEEELPFGVALQLLQRRVLGAPDEAELLDGAARLARPVLSGEVARTEPASAAHGLFWVVSNLAERAPVVLLVDDAHLADAPSLRFLVYLAQRLSDLRVAVLVAARPAEPTTGAEALAALRRHPQTTLVRPAPLSERGVGWLVAEAGFAGADPLFVQACACTTAGNPLFLRELLTVLRDGGATGSADDAADVERVGPVAVGEAVFLTLSRLSHAATSLARALAVLGDDTPLPHAARLAGLDVGAAAEIAARLIDAGLLAPGPRLTFAHPVVRQSVLDDLRPFERRVAHGRAAATLYELHAAPEVIAAHLLGADPVGASWAADALREVARAAAAAGEPTTAARALRRALEEPLAAAERPAVLLDLARAEAACGDADADARFAAALEALDAPPDRARVVLEHGRALLHRGRYAQAAALFDRGRSELGGADAELEADLVASWAAASLWDPHQGAAALEQAAGSIAAVTEPTTAAEHAALANLAGGLLLRAEDRELALALARRAWGGGTLLDRLGPDDMTVYAVTAVLMETDELEEAGDVYATVLHAARTAGKVLPAATASYGRACFHLHGGRFADAIADVELAFDAERYGWGFYVSAALWVAANARLELGDVDGAAAACEVAPEREERLRGGTDYLALPLARGRVALARGDAQAALAALEPLPDATAPLGVLIGQFNWRPSLVRARALAGDVSGARSLADDAVAVARRWGAPTFIVQALRAQAVADPGVRVEALREAAAVAATSPAPHERAGTLADLGAALHAAGASAEAREPLRHALDLADRLGAAPIAATARAALIAAGGRPRRARVSGAAALTPGELRVVRLAADGHSNREIAEALFVTLKAVKWHLGNAYRKLDVSSRDELGAALGRTAPTSD